MNRMRVGLVAMGFALAAGWGAARCGPGEPLALRGPNPVFHFGAGKEPPNPFSAGLAAGLWTFYPSRPVVGEGWWAGSGDLVVEGNRLWLGAQSLYVFDRNTGRCVQTITAADGLPGGFIASLVLDGHRLWVGTSEGLGWINTRTGKVGRPVVGSVRTGGVSYLGAGPRSVFFKARMGMMRYDRTSATWDYLDAGRDRPRDLESWSSMGQVVPDGDDAWAETRECLLHFSGATGKWEWVRIGVLKGRPDEQIRSLCVSGEAAWLAVRGGYESPVGGPPADYHERWRILSQDSGVFRFSKADRKTRLYTTKDGLASNVVERLICVDGAVWAICAPETDAKNTRFIEGGLSRYDPKRDHWISYPEIGSHPARHVPVALQADGALWVAFPICRRITQPWLEYSERALVAPRTALGEVTGLVVARYSPGEDAWTAWEDAADAEPTGLIVGRDAVLTATDPVALRLRGRPGRLRGALLSSLDPRTGQWRRLGARDTRHARPRRALQANDGSIWIIEGDRLRCLDCDGSLRLDDPDAFLPGTPTAITAALGSQWAIGGEGAEWRCGRPGRLIQRDPSGQWSRVPPDPNLPETVWALAGDEAGNLWVASVRFPQGVMNPQSAIFAPPNHYKGPWALDLARFDGREWRKWSWEQPSAPPKAFRWQEPVEGRLSFTSPLFYRLAATTHSQWVIGSAIPGVLELRDGQWVLHRNPMVGGRMLFAWTYPSGSTVLTLYQGAPLLLHQARLVLYDPAADRWQEAVERDNAILGVLSAGHRLMVIWPGALGICDPRTRKAPRIECGGVRYATGSRGWRLDDAEEAARGPQRFGIFGGPPYGGPAPMAWDGKHVWLAIYRALIRATPETGDYLAVSAHAGLPVYPMQLVADGSTIWAVGPEGSAALDTTRLPAPPSEP